MRTNSEAVLTEEYGQILRRKEYTGKAVDKFFKHITPNKDKTCHNCGKGTLGTMAKLLKTHYCHFCIACVCSKECLAKDPCLIPRDFNFNFDLQKKPVCTLASVFLNRKSYLAISSKHSQLQTQDSLYQFMVARRRLHKLFDTLRCEGRHFMLERSGFAGDKNLVLKECLVSMD